MNSDHYHPITTTTIINKLKNDGVKEVPLIHTQNVIRAVVDTGIKCDVSYEVKEDRDIILNFAMKKSFPLREIIEKITLPTNCVRAAHIIAERSSAKLTATLPFVHIVPSKDRDRDRDRTPEKKYKFTNAINNVFEHIGLNERDLAVAQTVQRYMINIHILQPLVVFSVVEKGTDPDTFIINAEDVDIVDLFFLHALMKECEAVREIEFLVPETTPGTDPVFVLRFTVSRSNSTKNKEAPARRAWSLF